MRNKNKTLFAVFMHSNNHAYIFFRFKQRFTSQIKRQMVCLGLVKFFISSKQSRIHTRIILLLLLLHNWETPCRARNNKSSHTRITKAKPKQKRNHLLHNEIIIFHVVICFMVFRLSRDDFASLCSSHSALKLQLNISFFVVSTLEQF